MNDNPLQPDYPDLSGKTILIADDMDENYILLEIILKKTNARLIWAKDGKEAVNIFLKDCKAADLILMDLKMPIMSGMEAIEIIHKLCPDIPIIAQTAFGFEFNRRETLAAGCVDFIEKPLSRSRVLILCSDILTEFGNEVEFLF